jgi:hypothetical protein
MVPDLNVKPPIIYIKYAILVTSFEKTLSFFVEWVQLLSHFLYTRFVTKFTY